MSPAEVVIPETEMKLAFHPIVFLGEAYGLASEPAVLVSHCAVLSFDESRVEMLAHR